MTEKATGPMFYKTFQSRDEDQVQTLQTFQNKIIFYKTNNDKRVTLFT